MISMFKIASSADAARYHDSALVEGQDASHHKADNYYANETALATWQGDGAKVLGIEGQKIDRDDFIAFLDGKITNPKTGELQDLASNSKGEDRRLGYDLTISAPKSVSVVALAGGDARVVEAHVNANDAAMKWLEKHGAQVRIKEGGQNKTVNTGNLLYATVQHETSRANDPQLHNHNVIVGVSYDDESSKWRSLTNDELFRIRTTADSIYKNELARGLKSIGYEIDYAAGGRDFEIRGVSREQLQAFSERTAQINAALEARGIDPASASHAARQTAALDSRAAKSDLGKSVLSEMWREKALDAGLDIDRVVSEARDRADGNGPLVQDTALAAHTAVSRAIDHLAEREQSFKVAELEGWSVYFSGGDSSIAKIQDAIVDRKAERSLLDRPDAKAPMITTSAAVSMELTLQDSIEKGKGKGLAVVASEQDFNQALAAFEAKKTEEVGKTFKLSGEQVNAARNVLMHEDKFQGIQGDAGTGKTAALEFVHQVIRDEGWLIQGIATSSTGATELKNATGIPSQTVAAFMLERDKQLKMERDELQKLTIQIAHSPGTAARVKLIERRDMDLTHDGKNLGRARYVFDNKTGDVFKSEAGPLNPLNVLGHKLSDAGAKLTEEASKERDSAEAFGERFRAKSRVASGMVQSMIGRGLASYEKVGTVEASAARDLHEADKDREYNTLTRQLATTAARVENLERTGNAEGKKYMLVMDESSMTGSKDSARIAEIAHELGARVILQGDVKQHGSVAAGKAMKQTHDAGINLSRIEETRRFDNATPQTKRAIAEMKLGNYGGALGGLDTTIAGADDLYVKVAERYIVNREELIAQGHADPKIGIVALTNADRQAVNIEVRKHLQGTGALDAKQFAKEHLDDPKLTEAQRRYVVALRDAGVNRMTALRDYESQGIRKEEMLVVEGYNTANNTVALRRSNGTVLNLDPDKLTKFSVARIQKRDYAIGDKVEARANIGRRTDPDRITNGTRGVIKQVDANGAQVAWLDGKNTTLDNAAMRQIDHAYAHTSHKEQGVTNQVEIFAVSSNGASIINREAAYVAASRAKGNTEIVTNAHAKMLGNAGKETTKTTAVDIADNLDKSILNAGTEKPREQTQERAEREVAKKIDQSSHELTR